MHRKRYTRKAGVQLLARLMSAVNKQQKPRAVQAAMLSLLRGQFGDFFVGEQTIKRFEIDPPQTVVADWLGAVRGMLIGAPVLPETQITIMSQSLRVSVEAIDAEIEGPIGHMMALQMILLIRLIGPEKVGQCECGRFYVRSGKRRFCSNRCQKRIYMQKFRAGEAGKE